jgi:hypothetical protein
MIPSAKEDIIIITTAETGVPTTKKQAINVVADAGEIPIQVRTVRTNLPNTADGTETRVGAQAPLLRAISRNYRRGSINMADRLMGREVLVVEEDRERWWRNWCMILGMWLMGGRAGRIYWGA